MRFYLLEKDLDERDALHVIYDCQVIELLENPFAQHIVEQIWAASQFNVHAHSLFAVSSCHRLTFAYDHCRHDEEERLRFYQKRDLARIGCHGLQFTVWRYSGESRHLVYSVSLIIFYAILHTLLTAQMSRSLYFWNNSQTIAFWQAAAQDPTVTP